jgi:hypothetical protein
MDEGDACTDRRNPACSSALPLIVYAVVVVGWWQIVSKAGYRGAWALIAFVPLVNLVFFFVFAISDWPILKSLRTAQSAAIPPAPP